ncbi:hypothetical protein SPAR91_1174 [Streptococcus pneumoniae GA47283]|nr:hypothetical protein SPAR91_1174 [Streptococcus pneumoniae GA47283]
MSTSFYILKVYEYKKMTTNELENQLISNSPVIMPNIT